MTGTVLDRDFCGCDEFKPAAAESPKVLLPLAG